MLGMSLGMVVEGSVAVLLAVTIGYCVVLNAPAEAAACRPRHAGAR